MLTKFEEKRIKQCGHIHTRCVMNCLLHGTLFRLKVQKFMGLSIECTCSKKNKIMCKKLCLINYGQQNLMNCDLD
jgi:hypothetical protein